MAMKLGTGAEAYAPLARSIIGGLLVSVIVTMYLVSAVLPNTSFVLSNDTR